jgi:hypothetical protein
MILKPLRIGIWLWKGPDSSTEWSAIQLTSTHPCVGSDLLHTYYLLHVKSINFCIFSMYVFFVMHFSEDGHSSGRNTYQEYNVYNALSYTYAHLLVLKSCFKAVKIFLVVIKMLHAIQRLGSNKPDKIKSKCLQFSIYNVPEMPQISCTILRRCILPRIYLFSYKPHAPNYGSQSYNL